jgi:hydroxymethylpyrimidine/phosphomethylpyrimidine kinase
MSASITAQIDALTAKFQADMDGISAEQTELHGEISTLSAELAASQANGTPVTQAQVDALAAIETRAATLAAPVTVTAPPPVAA